MLKFLISLLIFLVVTKINAELLLSCRVISSICQDDTDCLDRMNVQFPNCYMDNVKRSIEDKRASPIKLYDLLRKLDRIPAG